MTPTCATGCEDALATLPGFAFSECAPEINAGEIEKIYLGIPGNPFTNWALATEWNARLISTTATKITAVTVIGDKPKPTVNSQPISGGRTVKLESDHVLNFLIDESSAANHEAVRQLECGGQFLAWYVTSGGLLFGGNAGIGVSIEAGMVIPNTRADKITYQGSMTWKAKFTEERIISPIA